MSGPKTIRLLMTPEKMREFAVFQRKDRKLRSLWNRFYDLRLRLGQLRTGLSQVYDSYGQLLERKTFLREGISEVQSEREQLGVRLERVKMLISQVQPITLEGGCMDYRLIAHDVSRGTAGSAIKELPAGNSYYDDRIPVFVEACRSISQVLRTEGKKLESDQARINALMSEQERQGQEDIFAALEDITSQQNIDEVQSRDQVQSTDRFQGILQNHEMENVDDIENLSQDWLEEPLDEEEQLQLRQQMQSYIAKSIDDVMEDMGYPLAGEREVKKRSGKQFKNYLYEYDDGVAIRVTKSDDGKIAMELGGLDRVEREPDEKEREKLSRQMEHFCEDFSEFEQRLAKKGIVCGEYLSMLPPSGAYAQIINLEDYELIREPVLVSVSEKSRKDKREKKEWSM